MTPGDTLSIIVTNSALSGGSETISYVVQSGDYLSDIAAGLVAAFNANTELQSLGITSSNSAAAQLAWSQSFSGNGQLAAGMNTAAISAVDGGNNAKTNLMQVSANSPSATSLTYDANGNMTSDGTNSFAWDAENRLIKITYPGSNNFSTFVYDPLWRNVKIVETVSGSVTDTKQFVWCKTDRCEERDSGGSVSKKFFSNGETVSTDTYLYAKDLLGSSHNVTDNSGVVQIEYFYDPYGQKIKLFGALESDFQFAGYYYHQRSNLNLTAMREYSSKLGIWLSRDPLDGASYDYVGGSPIDSIDPLGLRPLTDKEKKFLKKFVNCIDDRVLSSWQIYENWLGAGVSPGFGHLWVQPSTFIRNNGDNEVNFSDPASVYLFAHEAFHQIQAYTGIDVLTEGATHVAANRIPGVDTYAYTPSWNSKANLETFLNAGLEGQARMFADYVAGTGKGGGSFSDILKYINAKCSCREKRTIHPRGLGATKVP